MWSGHCYVPTMTYRCSERCNDHPEFPKPQVGGPRFTPRSSDSHLASFLCPSVTSYLPPESENHSLAQCFSDVTRCWPKDHILNSKDLEVTFLLCCLPREVLLADHNLKRHLSNLRMPRDHWEAYETCRIPRPTWRASDRLWSMQDHTFGNKSPRKFCCGPAGYTQEVQFWVTECLPWPRGPGTCRGGLQGVKARKDVQLLPQPSQQSKGMLGIFSWGCRMVLRFCRPSPVSSPLYSGNVSLLSYCPLSSSPLSLWSATSGAEEQRAPHLWTALLPHPWGVAASSRPWQIYAPWVPHTTALRDFISLGYKILAITKSILCSQPTDFSTWSIWEN